MFNFHAANWNDICCFFLFYSGLTEGIVTSKIEFKITLQSKISNDNTGKVWKIA